MASVTQAGAIIFTPVPAFLYHALIDDSVDHSFGRMLDLFDLITV
jgi:3-polyprenyl-4-hydroxybenzoate decarboxylase